MLGKKNPFLVLSPLLKIKSTTANKQSPACFHGKPHENNTETSETGATKNGGIIKNNNMRKNIKIS
ncbi:MAG: hypothetical protein J5710_12725 [Treponema sp.]|nr:hypothetical protein [Treponema sp.]